jgi:hypothetical protein
MTVRRLTRGAEDGYASPLVPGLHSSDDAARLAEEIAFAAHRLEVLAGDPPGLYASVGAGGASNADAADVEERAWLAFLIAYLYPLEEDDPFAEIERVRTSWASGELPDLSDVRTGPRSAHQPGRASATLRAYRSWSGRAGTQARAFTGEDAWTSERRFDRVYERLALPGMHRDARFELLVSLGQLGVFGLEAASLHVGGADEVTVAAKRALGIGDPMLLARRSAALAEACQVPLAALDLALYSWGVGTRAHGGLPPGAEPDDAMVERCRSALGLD